MSLKAKLEAVIYAAEEPVTLAQLAAIFSADALEWKAEQEAASAESEDDAKVLTPLLGEDFGAVELEGAGERPETTASVAEAPSLQQDLPTVGNEETAPEAVVAAPEVVPEEAVSEADAEGELKRQNRLRDREVRGIIKQLLDEIVDSYVSDERGVEIREIAGGYRMATKPECHDAVRLFVKSLKPVLKLSLAALETLAVVAYKQPVTAPEVSEIRGVEAGGVLGSLLARKLIATAGRKQVIGRPILYKTTKEFLLRFGLKDIAELPSMEEFEKMAAIELEEPDGEETAPAPEQDQKEIGWSDELESDEANGEDLPISESETGAEPAEELPAQVQEPQPDGAPQSVAHEPADLAEPQPAEAPAETAAG